MTTKFQYRIEHKVRTLADNAVRGEGERNTFMVEGVRFSHWDFNIAEGWVGDAWIAEAIIGATTLKDAANAFYGKVRRIIPRVSLVAQCFVRITSEPFIVQRTDLPFAFVRHVIDRGAVGLHFRERQLEALKLLLLDQEIPEEFFYYWNDAVNVPGYSAKLLLMFAAIDALIERGGPRKDFPLRKEIFGEELSKELFQRETALRNRLSHGEYFDSSKDSASNYVEVIHRAIMKYFNNRFGAELLPTNVVHPQRHFEDNFARLQAFLQRLDSEQVSLKDALTDLEENGTDKLQRHRWIMEEAITKNY